ncbi:LEA domain protein [Aspergillus undulatus]|uniref:LEA domain protein n=1 Tax=Aspergillus undulatus TaxID=1810928 RepID=UPI003CCD04DA
MWSPLAKSDQRSNAGSERKLSGSSAAPSEGQKTDFNPKEAVSGAQDTAQENVENVKEQAPDVSDQKTDLEQKGQEGQEEEPSTPTPQIQQKETLDTEQRDDNEDQSQADDQSQAGGSGGGIFGKLKSLGGGLGNGVSSTVKNVPGLASKPLGMLKGLSVQDNGEIPGPDGNVVGRVVEGGEDAIGGTVEEGGKIVNQAGETIGQAELADDAKQATDDVQQKGEEVTEDAEKTAEDAQDNLPPISDLEGLTCNKAGKIVDPDSGKPVGELVEGDPKKLSRLGSKLDDKGQFWDSRGNVIGKAKTIPAEDYGEEPPFAGLEGLHVVKDGFVEDQGGRRVGKLTEGDEKKLIGRPVDEDGDVTDQHGSVKGHAEPYEEPEEEQPEEDDLSSLEGKTVNKAGNVVDEHGKVFGRIVSGDGKRLAGRKVDGKGQIWGDNGKVIGKAELIPGDEQEKPEGEFYGFENLTVGKDGVVQDPSGRVVGRVIQGDATKLSGRQVDEDGEILDKSGNVIGKAERWEPEEKKRDVNPMSGRKVIREGEVRDTDGNLIGKLTEGNLSSLIGKEIDDNGYVVDNDGNKIGECTLLEHLPEPEPEEPEPEPEPEPSPEEKEAQRKAEEDRELAKKMSAIVGQTLNKVGPICKQITDHVDRAEKTPKDELDEEQLVKNVKPLLEEANSILQECNGAIRALDPDGHVAANAKARAASHEASPEEHGLAEKLKELSDNVLRTIENGKKKIDGMPHAKKALNPLWGLLSEPLFQIIAAVGLLLTGVLGLVGRLLDGLGLGPLVNGLLGGLGLDKLLGNLGLTSLTDSLGLTGNKK